VKQTTGFYPRLIVDTATSPAVGQAGGVLLTETITLTGLGRELATALAPWRKASAVHHPAKVITDLALTQGCFILGWSACLWRHAGDGGNRAGMTVHAAA